MISALISRGAALYIDGYGARLAVFDRRTVPDAILILRQSLDPDVAQTSKMRARLLLGEQVSSGRRRVRRSLGRGRKREGHGQSNSE